MRPTPIRTVLLPLALSVVLALGACASKPPQPTQTASTAVAPGAGANANGANGANALGANRGGADSGEDIDGPREGLLAQRVVYFDFDSSEIKSEYQALVAAHAKYLVGHPNAHIRLEGNTDDRGSREYNIGLGERRAQAVKRALLLQGVGEGQVATVSYGAERPAVAGHDEAAFAKNRRVEINYVQ